MQANDAWLDFFSFVSCCVADRFVIIPLHSLMPTVNQTQVRFLPFLCLSVFLSVIIRKIQPQPYLSLLLRCSKGLLPELERLWLLPILLRPGTVMFVWTIQSLFFLLGFSFFILLLHSGKLRSRKNKAMALCCLCFFAPDSTCYYKQQTWDWLAYISWIEYEHWHGAERLTDRLVVDIFTHTQTN